MAHGLKRGTCLRVDTQFQNEQESTLGEDEHAIGQ
jgi:hypothetical protein